MIPFASQEPSPYLTPPQQVEFQTENEKNQSTPTSSVPKPMTCTEQAQTQRVEQNQNDIG